MKRLCIFLLAALVSADAALVSAQTWSGVYVGGHIRRQRPATLTRLKESGFTYVLLFNINVEEDGTLTTDGETVCENGRYVFASTQPHYVEDIQSLKEHPTSIRHIEIVIGGWNNQSFFRIRDILNAHPTDLTATALYRNFRALKRAIPEIDGVNNDDEHCYDLATGVRFHTMMYDLGYVTSIAPYMNRAYWQQLTTQLNDARPGACERVLVQCYDGGAYNNPSDWHFGNIPLLAGRLNYQEGGMSASIRQMEQWRDESGVVGGFVWVYNDETWNLNEWAMAMNKVFRTQSKGVCTVYAQRNFGGESVELPAGEYRSGDLAAYGLTNSSIQSFQLAEGYMLTGYRSTDLTGTSSSWQESAEDPGSRWRGRIYSLRVEAIPDGVAAAAEAPVPTVLYDLSGRRLLREPDHGAYILRRGSESRVIAKP